MTNGSNMEAGPDILGQKIEAIEVLGKEFDGEDRWVGADVEVRIADAGNFFLNIVTKRWYLNEELEATLDKVNDPDQFFAAGLDEETEEKQPYVLNDTELSDDILRGKFIGRVVMSDLADSLWPMQTEDRE